MPLNSRYSVLHRCLTSCGLFWYTPFWGSDRFAPDSCNASPQAPPWLHVVR